jgi:hypothetical protein
VEPVSPTSETRPDRPMVDCPRGHAVRSARNRFDSRDVGPAIKCV